MTPFNFMNTEVLAFGGLEIATFRLLEGVSEGELLSASERVDKEFMVHQDGVLGHVLLRGRDGVYADLAFADSQGRAEAVCAKWTANAVALQYVELLDDKSVNMTFWKRLR